MISPPPIARSQPCEVCGFLVRFQHIPAPCPGMADVVAILAPGDAWIGFEYSKEHPEQLALFVFCTQSCVVHWHELEHHGIRPTPEIAS